MDSLGVDVQVVSTTSNFYQYGNDVATTLAIAKDCNDEVHQMTMGYPDRFRGFATLPMQDPKTAISELDRAMHQLGLVGAMIDDSVNGKTYDEPECLPFWKAAEQGRGRHLFHRALRLAHPDGTIGQVYQVGVASGCWLNWEMLSRRDNLKA